MGRWLQTFAADTKVLRYPALAEENEEYRDKGEPLFPEFKSLTFLLERKKLYSRAGWESLYHTTLRSPHFPNGSLRAGFGSAR
jgi:hypothetical protein